MNSCVDIKYEDLCNQITNYCQYKDDKCITIKNDNYISKRIELYQKINDVQSSLEYLSEDNQKELTEGLNIIRKLIADDDSNLNEIELETNNYLNAINKIISDYKINKEKEIENERIY